MRTDILNIECLLNNDDVIAWNNYSLQNSPEWKRINKHKHANYVTAVVIPIIGTISLIKGITSEFFVWGWVGIGLILFGVIPLLSHLYTINYWRNNIRKNVNKLYGHGKDTFVGVHSYTISQEGIHDVTKLDDTTIKWEAIENIVQTNKHIFIIVPPRSALIIPKRSFPDDSEFNKFMQDLKAIYQTSDRLE